MTTATTTSAIEKVAEKFGKTIWEKNGLRRVYINLDELGLEVSRTCMRELEGSKFYFDSEKGYGFKSFAKSSRRAALQAKADELTEELETL